jgi:hypothetical protein
LAGVDQPGLAPRLGEVVGRRGGEHRRTFDARDPRRRDEQILRLAHDILEDGVAGGEVDHGAGRGMAELGLVHHAAAMDDLPQDIRVGGGTEKNDGQQGGDDGQGRDRSPQPIQPHPHLNPTLPIILQL